MNEPQEQYLIGTDGELGRILSGSESETADDDALLVELHNGARALVPQSLLTITADGQYAIALSRAEIEDQLRAHQRIVLPVMAEELHVEKRQHITGRIRVRKLVREHEELVDEQLLREYVEVERMPLNRPLEEPAKVRYEGDVMVIPVMEELIVVEKRLVLREEVRLVKRVESRPYEATATLRSEEVVVERVPGDVSAEQTTDS
jgi:uncharacterized protein (TIGR02271 family)